MSKEIIKTRGLTKVFETDGSRVTAIKGINLVINKGENVFMRDDDELALFRNREIGFVFQFHYLLSEFSALENVMMPLLIQGIQPNEAREIAAIILKRDYC